MSPEIIKELRQLQNENTPLKKVVAEQVLNNQILKEAINLSKNAKPGGAVHMDYRTDGETGRQACRALGQHRSTQRYESKQPDKDRELIEEIRTQVKHRKYGYRRITKILRCSGW